MSYVLEREWQPYNPCPCGCAATGAKLKLTKPCVPGGCVVGCQSPSCRNRRNRRKGKAGEYHRHRNLGGEGWTPHDELPYTYTLDVTTQDKVG